jgi:endogenous inhibitor of DNA gyrase (YacG/DUF329 family)
VACPTCGLRIPLDAVVVLGEQRSLCCERCHSIETWDLGRRGAAVTEIELRD